MDKRTDSRIEAMFQTLDCLKTNTTIWSTMTPFSKAFHNLNNIKDDIVGKCIAASLTSMGLSMDKKLRETTMISNALKVGSAVYEFADDADDNELKQKVDFKRWQLIKMSDLEKETVCREIYITASACIADMGTDYIFDQADLVDFDKSINDYALYITKPRQAIVSSSSAKTEVREMIKQGYLIMSKLDRLMVHFETTQPQFHETYFKSRNIILKGSSSKTDNNTTDDNAGDDITAPNEYTKTIPAGAIVVVDFQLKSNLTYLITHLEGGKLKYWTANTSSIPLSIPETFATLAEEAEIEIKGSSLDADHKPFLFFANSGTSDDAIVAVDVLEE